MFQWIGEEFLSMFFFTDDNCILQLIECDLTPKERSFHKRLRHGVFKISGKAPEFMDHRLHPCQQT